jgi:addiction module RelB/DinJ family antitoxin
MNSVAVINLKTEPLLKKQALELSKELGISLSSILNNELNRFVKEKSVSFEIIESPNDATAASIKASKKLIDKGTYHTFKNNTDALDFLTSELS